jgi:hypothetical protein
MTFGHFSLFNTIALKNKISIDLSKNGYHIFHRFKIFFLKAAKNKTLISLHRIKEAKQHY